MQSSALKDWQTLARLLRRALCQFLWHTGLDRSPCILHDLDAIAKASPGEVPLQLSPTQQVQEHVRMCCCLIAPPRQWQHTAQSNTAAIMAKV